MLRFVKKDLVARLKFWSILKFENLTEGYLTGGKSSQVKSLGVVVEMNNCSYLSYRPCWYVKL